MISLLRQKKEHLLHLILYEFIGIGCASLDYAIFYLINNQLCLYYILANCISVSIAISLSFALNAFLNFRKKDHLLHRFLCFFGVGMLGLIFGSILLYIFIDIFHIQVLISKFISIFFVTAIQFILNKFFSFRELTD